MATENHRSTDSPLHRTGGVVLCGGRSSRMGAPKHLLPFGKRTMLQAVVETLRAVVAPVVVVRAADQDLPQLPADALLAQDEEPELGPLSGMSAGLSLLSSTCDAAFVASCDAPLLRPDVVRFLVQSLGNHDAAVVRNGGFCHVLAAAYSMRLLPRIQDMVRDRRLRLQSLIEDCDARILNPDEIRPLDPELLSFRNVNTPDDYAALLKLVGIQTTVSRNPSSQSS